MRLRESPELGEATANREAGHHERGTAMPKRSQDRPAASHSLPKIAHAPAGNHPTSDRPARDKRRADLKREISERLGNLQRAPQRTRAPVVAVRHEVWLKYDEDPAEPPLIAQCLGERSASSRSRGLSRSHRAARARPEGRSEDRWPAPDVSRSPGRWLQRRERLLEVADRLPMAERADGLGRRPGGDTSTALSHTSPRNAWWASRSTCSASRSA